MKPTMKALIGSCAILALVATTDSFARERNATITTGGGKTLNRKVTRTYDPATGTVNRSVTGVGGKTRSATGTRVKNEDGSVTYNTTGTGPNGQTYNRTATNSVDPETGTATRTVTGPGGNTRTGTATIEKGSTSEGEGL
ncbi:MAG: hypothetical protein SFX19_03280 [Alphaproteobacteria bacterium]|nr:hypothetical protein [Alphaproteobacteria bacterium]